MAGRLITLCGLPGSGKTTVATRLESDSDAVRFSSDDWMDGLGLNLWDAETRIRIEALQWQQAQRLLELGQTVVIEWGTWTRSEREAMRTRAVELGAVTELHVLEAEPEELFRRIAGRDREDPPITRAHLDEWVLLFETPTTDEIARWDRCISWPRQEEAKPI